jgi:predicted NAD-dependent protein-ADP-ribosyltransferase YbiA (DUF1768 family)
VKVLLKEKILVLAPEAEVESAELTAWKAIRSGHVMALRIDAGNGIALVDLGPREDVCNEPINVISTSTDPAARLISNFAATPFELDGRMYASVEGFWQGLKCTDSQERRRIADLAGGQAQKAGQSQPYEATITYEGEVIPVGTYGHWELMRRANWAKFTQHAEARDALLSTGERPLIHKVRRDSRIIPGVIMADIWMRIRSKLRERQPERL